MIVKTLNLILTSAVALTASSTVSSAHAISKDKEMCYGVVKAGKNDCGSADKAHGCAGMAKEDASGIEWIGLPKGLCERLAGGSLTPVTEDAPEATAPAEKPDGDGEGH